MKTMKKIMQVVLMLVLVLVVVCCLTALHKQVQAASYVVKFGKCGENVSWVLYDNGKLVISGTGPMSDSNSYSGMNWDSLNPRIKEVVIEEGVTYIGKYVFENCGFYDEVVSITIPSTVTEMGKYAFNNISNLEKVCISDLSAWCKISFGKNSNPLDNRAALYLNGTEVKHLVIPNGVTSITDRAFAYCTSIESATIPASVRRIDVYAFSCCDNLTRICFLGDAPSVQGIIIPWTTTAFYPKGNKTWTESVRNTCNSDSVWLENETRTPGWFLKNGKWYYQDHGMPMVGWMQEGGKTYYFASNAQMQTGWAKIKGSWYYFSSSGAKQTGWLFKNGQWYYLDNDGVMQIGWHQSGNTFYFLRSSGAMVTGWYKTGGQWYFFKDSGGMASGWIYDAGEWYYLKPSGAMATGWLQQGSTWYYLKPSGAMATGTVYIDGTAYNFDSSGAWIQ